VRALTRVLGGISTSSHGTSRPRPEIPLTTPCSRTGRRNSINRPWPSPAATTLGREHPAHEAPPPGGPCRRGRYATVRQAASPRPPATRPTRRDPETAPELVGALPAGLLSQHPDPQPAAVPVVPPGPAGPCKRFEKTGFTQARLAKRGQPLDPGSGLKAERFLPPAKPIGQQAPFPGALASVPAASRGRPPAATRFRHLASVPVHGDLPPLAPKIIVQAPNLVLTPYMARRLSLPPDADQRPLEPGTARCASRSSPPEGRRLPL